MARSTARKRALNTLYEADEKGQDIPSLLAERIAEPGAQTPLPDYAIQIVRGVADEQAGIDRALEAHSTKWPLKRMAVVDRNILRIAAWEILFNDDVPGRVAIDEALGLAKSLSDDDSPAFIHGLLSALCDDKETVLADIKAAHEAEAKEKAEREAAERRANAPTRPGFLKAHGISGKGDGISFDSEIEDEPEAKEGSESEPGATANVTDEVSSDAGTMDSLVPASEDSVDSAQRVDASLADSAGGSSDGLKTDDESVNENGPDSSSGGSEEISLPHGGGNDGAVGLQAKPDGSPVGDQSGKSDEEQPLPFDGDNNSIIV